MVHGKNRISYRIDWRLSGLAGPDYDATISFGLPIEPEDSQYGKYRIISSLLWASRDYADKSGVWTIMKRRLFVLQVWGKVRTSARMFIQNEYRHGKALDSL